MEPAAGHYVRLKTPASGALERLARPMKRHGHRSHAKSTNRRPSSAVLSAEADPEQERHIAHYCPSHQVREQASSEHGSASAGAIAPPAAGLLHYAVSIAIVVIGALSMVFALYVGEEILFPLVVAVVIRLLLAPAQRFLTERARLPSWAAGIVLVIALIGLISAVAAAVTIPASQWVQKAPETIPALKQKIVVLRRPIDYLQQGLSELEGAVSAQQEIGPSQAPASRPYSPIFGNLAGDTATVLARFFTAMVLLFFLLSFGDRLLRAFIEILPHFAEKRRTVEIANEIEGSITKYLVIVTLMNAAVGTATALLMWAFGFSDPILWGTAAFLLNYVPILGPLVGVLVFFAAGLLTFDSPWYATLPACGYLLIHVIEGENVTPMLLASRLTLNPILVLLSVFCWYALWGIPGAFLAVPLLAIFKIFCDRIDPLKPIGHLIGS